MASKGWNWRIELIDDSKTNVLSVLIPIQELYIEWIIVDSKWKNINNITNNTCQTEYMYIYMKG